MCPGKLGQDGFGRNASTQWIAIDASCQVVPRVVVYAQDWIAAVGLAEAFERLAAVEGVDEDGNEGGASRDNAWIAERTAREELATLSPGVFAEVDPERFVGLASDLNGRFVVEVPVDLPDAAGGGIRRALGGRIHMACSDGEAGEDQRQRATEPRA